MSFFFGAFFFPFGIYIPFFGVWLKSLGMDAPDIGLILTIPLIIRVLTTPFMAALADKIGDRRLTLQVYCFVFAATFSLIVLNHSLLWIAFVMALSHIAQNAVIPVADSLAMAGSRRFDLDYGRMRSWGSVSFMLANLAGGFVLDILGADKIIWVMVAGNVLHLIFSMTLPSDPRLADNKNLTKGAQLNWSQLSQFAQTGFWIVLISTALLQSSHSLLYAFATIYWQKIGFAPNMTGVFWSASVMAEVALFIVSKKLVASVGWKPLLITGCIIACIRWLLFPLELSATGYLLLQLLHAGSFACSHLGMMFFLSEVVDDELSGTAQGLYTMITGLLMAVVTFFSGMLYARWGGDAFFLMSTLSLAALLLLFVLPLFPMGHIKADASRLE